SVPLFPPVSVCCSRYRLGPSAQQVNADDVKNDEQNQTRDDGAPKGVERIFHWLSLKALATTALLEFDDCARWIEPQYRRYRKVQLHPFQDDASRAAADGTRVRAGSATGIRRAGYPTVIEPIDGCKLFASQGDNKQGSGDRAMRAKRLVGMLLFCTVLVAPATAEEPSGTLKKIKDSGVISLGHRESSIPFSYYDDKQRVVGYSHELALKVVDVVKQQLKLAKLDVKLTPVTSQNRISLVQNGTIDLECGSTTNNTERQQQVAFSNTIFIIGTRLLTRNNSGIKDFPDLAGK